MLESQGVTVVGEAAEATTALQLAEDLQPDVLMLDVQMPGLSGLQMTAALVQLDNPPLLVFVTGYSEHAVAAFEHDAVDYLLKPVAADRLARTVARVRERLTDRSARKRAAASVRQDVAKSEPLRRLPVREAYAVRLIRVEDIRSAAARDKRVFVRTSDGEHRTYYTLTQLQSLLPADRFLRIHDSFMVNLDEVVELLFLGNHVYEVRLTDGTRLPVGRTRYAELQQRLGLGILPTT
jgi:DNA-binding LytR/AlgR family response regulator